MFQVRAWLSGLGGGAAGGAGATGGGGAMGGGVWDWFSDMIFPSLICA
jgi:hypothetical protein